MAGILAGIELVCLDESIGRMIDEPLVPIVAAELHVAVGGQGLHLASGEPQQRDVECAAAQVVDQHVELLLWLAVGRQIAQARRTRSPRPSAR